MAIPYGEIEFKTVTNVVGPAASVEFTARVPSGVDAELLEVTGIVTPDVEGMPAASEDVIIEAIEVTRKDSNQSTRILTLGTPHFLEVFPSARLGKTRLLPKVEQLRRDDAVTYTIRNNGLLAVRVRLTSWFGRQTGELTAPPLVPYGEMDVQNVTTVLAQLQTAPVLVDGMTVPSGVMSEALEMSGLIQPIEAAEDVVVTELSIVRGRSTQRTPLLTEGEAHFHEVFGNAREGEVRLLPKIEEMKKNDDIVVRLRNDSTFPCRAFTTIWMARQTKERSAGESGRA